MGATSAAISDPSMHVGWNSGQSEALSALGIQAEQNRFKAAQDVSYDLGFGPDGSIMIPASCAHLNFGDWTIRPGDRSQARVKRTYQQERARVAMHWGDWLRMPHGRKTQQGVEADTRIIGAPPVPVVKIEVLEQNGKPTGDAFLPWEFYDWARDIDHNAAHEAKLIAQQYGFITPQPMGAPTFDLSNLPPEMIERLAEMIAQRNGGSGGKGKAQPG